jgi:ketosteroid isomerase-like protein
MSAKRQLLDRYVERYNARDLDGGMDLYAEDAVQIMPDGTYEGWNTVRERLAQELDGFTDLNHPQQPVLRHHGCRGPARSRPRKRDRVIGS